MGGKGGVPARALAEERCPSCDVELGEQDRAQRRCHRCGALASQEADRGREPIEEVGQFRAALDRWALEEGCRDGAELLETSFGGVSVEEAWARFSQGERLETTFDVLGFLFSNVGGGAGSLGGVQSVEEPPVLGVHAKGKEDEGERWGYAPTSRIVLPTGRSPNRRNRALALASIMAVDGQIRAEERERVDRLLREEEQPPLKEEELRVYRPHEVGPVGPLSAREELIELMLDLACADGEKDESELRLIREYARHWGVDPLRIDTWLEQHEARTVSVFRRTLRKLKALMLA
jgi:hypothetical protein